LARIDKRQLTEGYSAWISRRLDRRPVSTTIRLARGHSYKYYPNSLGSGMYCSAIAMSHALEGLVGHVDWLQRSLIFTHFRL